MDAENHRLTPLGAAKIEIEECGDSKTDPFLDFTEPVTIA
jgi:hypothetical protein